LSIKALRNSSEGFFDFCISTSLLYISGLLTARQTVPPRRRPIDFFKRQMSRSNDLSAMMGYKHGYPTGIGRKQKWRAS
jgi:hypothetical protein